MDVGDFAVAEAKALGELSAILTEGLGRSLLIGDQARLSQRMLRD